MRPGIRPRACKRATFAVAAAAVLLAPAAAYARRYEVVGPYEEYPVEPTNHLDLAVDGEGAVPIGIPQSPFGNQVSGGGGFKVRVGDQIRYPRLRLTPEVGYGYDHLFATDDFGDAFAWDMHRFLAGARVGVGRVVVPTLYAHVGYGWRTTPDPTVPGAGGFAFDAGVALDLHVVPHVGLGAHAEYATIDAQPFVPQWIALGIHADAAF